MKSSKVDEMNWIRKMVQENTKQGISTVLITLYDLISPSELSKNWITEKNVYLIRMLPRGGGAIKAFEAKNMAINDDVAQLEIMISDIIQYCGERKISCQIILYTLTWLIHTHGWRRIYSLLASIMSNLKNGPVQLCCFYYPETHEDKSEIARFEKLSDRIIEI